MAWEIGQRVRGIHKAIKGVKPDGERYHALEPSAYAWVHATLASALADGARTFGTPLRPEEQQPFWEEWVRLGRLIGLREQRPARALVRTSTTTSTRWSTTDLEDNPTVHLVLAALERPRPRSPESRRATWRVLRKPIASAAAADDRRACSALACARG